MPDAQVHVVGDETSRAVHDSAFTPPGCMLRTVACSVSVYEQQGMPSRTRASSPKASWTWLQPMLSSERERRQFGPEQSPISPCPQVTLAPQPPGPNAAAVVGRQPARSSSTATRFESPLSNSATENDLLKPATPFPQSRSTGCSAVPVYFCVIPLGAGRHGSPGARTRSLTPPLIP